MNSAFPTDLLAWYDQNKRDLPWRQNNNPYYIWVSEIMLQQTRVEAVKQYFIRFIDALPTLVDLAEVEENKLMKLWEGLGYYNRVRNMQRCAKLCVTTHQGALPRDYQTLLTLPGIGLYTAGAIASIAHQIPVPAVDGNVMRVVSRLTNNPTDIAKDSYKKLVYEQIKEIMPDRPGDFNQAIMDLGATICIPNGAPLCLVCPLNAYCQAYQNGTMNDLPTKTKKKARSVEMRTILLVTSSKGVLIQKRPETGLLAGLFEFISLNKILTQKQVGSLDLLSPFHIQSIVALPDAIHIFTHLEWKMVGFHVVVDDIQLPADFPYFWASTAEVNQTYSLPTAFKVYRDCLTSDDIR